jgi:hypothetical protein
MQFNHSIALAHEKKIKLSELMLQMSFEMIGLLDGHFGHD